VGNALAQNNVMTLLIGKATGAPTTAAGSPIIGTASLADGELAVVNGHNIVLSAVTSRCSCCSKKWYKTCIL